MKFWKQVHNKSALFSLKKVFTYKTGSLMRETDNSTIAGDLNTSLTILPRTMQKINKKIEDTSNIKNR